MAKQKITTTSHITRKEYRYNLGEVALSFTLRQDNSSELTKFLKLLKQAVVDCEADLTNFKK